MQLATWSARIGATLILVATVDLVWRLLDLHAGRGVAVAVTVPLAVLAAVRWWRFGLHLDDAGVRVVNLLREHRFAWEEVDAFRFDQRVGIRGVPGHPGRVVVRRRPTTISATWAFYPGEIARTIDRLRPFTTPRGVPVVPGDVGGDRPPPPPGSAR